MYEKCLQSLPEDIIEIKIAFYEDNVLCRRWCEKNRFILYNAETTMTYNKASFGEKEISSSIILKFYRSKYKKGLGSVHPKGTFFTLEELINSVSAYHPLILAVMWDEVLGYVYYEQTHDRKKGEIVLLHVREDKRSRGYGTVLLNKAIKEIINGKAEQITINVRVTNYDALKLYKRMGFTEKDTIYAYKRHINNRQ